MNQVYMENPSMRPGVDGLFCGNSLGMKDVRLWIRGWVKAKRG